MAVPSNPHRIGLIPEIPSDGGGRLGRHLHFDERSRAFGVPLAKGAKVVTRTWERTLAAFGQGITEVRLKEVKYRKLGEDMLVTGYV